MNAIRAVLLATLTVCGFAVALPTAAAPSPTAPADTSINTFQTEENATSSNSTLGAEISSFMQVSTSQAEGTVDTGLWVARFNQTQNRSAQQALVRHQTEDLETELDALQQRKRNLVEARNSGEISRLQYQARMSELVGDIRSVQHAINTTKPRAETVGTRVNRLQRLDRQANNVGGPEVAEVARSLNSVNVPGENANNSTNAPGVGNGSGQGNGMPGGETTPGNGNENGNAGNGSNGNTGNGNNGNGGNGDGGNENAGNGNSASGNSLTGDVSISIPL
ncbi:hypothetical protein SAMN05421858_2380 [Haladaptatus litoreus]|uniref:DUF7096 domain-containing protein n=1 Tax=Haladaptatus litoreus TaxID=553468 RepID=A0A1N7B751_9EURY|nr:hypothetical protein [Haladaptatus litoreus]SIR47134.1 hypothetical protein SAMN05421858_2380 [Haladaptatus litoreus]